MPDTTRKNEYGLQELFVDNGDGTYSRKVSATVAAAVGGATAANQDLTNAAIGAPADAAAGTDTATASQLSLFKRLLQKFAPLALQRTTMLAAVTATGAGSAVSDGGRGPSFSANVAGTGAVTATILVEGRNTASGVFFTLATITLSGTTSASDGFASLARYMEYRANLTAVSGTGAVVTVTMGS